MQVSSASDAADLELLRQALARGLAIIEAQAPEGPPPPLPPDRSPTVGRTKAAATKLFSRPPSRRNSVKIVADNPEIVTELARDEKLVGAIETLSNSCKNFTCLTLGVPEELSPRTFSQNLLDELTRWKDAYDAAQPLPQIQGKDVGELDKKSLRNLIGQIFVDETWTDLFHEMIARKDDAAHTRAFISPRVCKCLALLETESDARKIANHLMSECAHHVGCVRVVHERMLQLLLLDDRVKAFSGLRSAIKDAAHRVMLSAIRKCQGDIVFDSVTDKLQRRKVTDAWKKAAAEFGDTHHDLDGIRYIAKKAHVKLIIAEDASSDSQQTLVAVIKSKNRLSEILTIYNEKTP